MKTVKFIRVLLDRCPHLLSKFSVSLWRLSSLLGYYWTGIPYAEPPSPASLSRSEAAAASARLFSSFVFKKLFIPKSTYIYIYIYITSHCVTACFRNWQSSLAEYDSAAAALLLQDRFCFNLGTPIFATVIADSFWIFFQRLREIGEGLRPGPDRRADQCSYIYVKTGGVPVKRCVWRCGRAQPAGIFVLIQVNIIDYYLVLIVIIQVFHYFINTIINNNNNN